MAQLTCSLHFPPHCFPGYLIRHYARFGNENWVRFFAGALIAIISPARGGFWKLTLPPPDPLLGEIGVRVFNVTRIKAGKSFVVRVRNSRIVLSVYTFVMCGTLIQELHCVPQVLSPSQYGDGYFRLHSRHCVVKSRNKLLWPSVCRMEENDPLMCLFQISDETNVLQDGTLIDLCGATLLWRSHEGLEKSPVSWIYVWYPVRGIQVLSYEPVRVRMPLKRGCLYISIQKCDCWRVQHTVSTRVKLVDVIKKLMIVYMFLKLQNNASCLTPNWWNNQCIGHYLWNANFHGLTKH